MKRTSNPTPTSSTINHHAIQRRLTATRDVLLPDRSDHALRTLLYNLFTIGARMEDLRRYLGSEIGISGPQFTLMMAVLELQGELGVSVGRIADYLHVAGTFVTAESGKLAQKGYLQKRTDPRDRRVSLLRLVPAGLKAIDSLLPELQQINDTFFAVESRDEFMALCRSVECMVQGSESVLELLRERTGRSVQ